MQPRPRIASLCPSNTELVCAMGLGDCLIAVDNYSDYPVHVVAHLPKLGPDLHINVDKLRSLSPDLTLCSLSVPGMERVVEQVATSELPYIVLSPHSIGDVLMDLRNIAAALPGSVPQVTLNALIDELSGRVARIEAATSKLTHRPSLYWEWWPNPVFSPAKRNWLTELSRIAGGRNIFECEDGDQVQDSGARVLAANPDYFLAVWTGVPQHKVPIQKIRMRDGWSSLPALSETRLYILPEGLYCRPSPRLIDGLEQLVRLIHPEVADDLGLPNAEFHGPVRRIDGSWFGGKDA